ncbi:MAG TPA: PHB depolymerase family esterase [Ramlibacter sp.]|nr:PHB depolymerase family esterase [Ramlibacter sp.]
MNPLFQRLMQHATRLTGKGDLRGATAAIKAALSGAPPSPSIHPDAPAANDPQVIDVAAREVAPSPAPSPQVAPETKPVPPQSPPQPAGQGEFIAGHYTGSAGARDFKLYIPPAAGERALPLVVMLHGCTQDPDDFAAGTGMNDAASGHGFFVLYPAQSRQANPQRCWNWFKHNHQARGRGEPELLAGMTRDIMARYAIDPQRVYVAGLSAGGAMAAILGDAYPDLFAAVGVHSGLATGIAKDLPSALGAMKSGGSRPGGGAASGVPTIVFHGDADATVHPGNGEHVISASAGAAEGEVEKGYSRAGRNYTRRVHRNGSGEILAEHWLVHGAQHAWSGGTAQGSYTDPRGPDATAEMVRFFLAHPRRAPR